MWFLSNPLHKTYSNEMEMQENIINNILFFSDDEYDISCLKKVINKPDLSVHPIDSNYEVITIYMDGDAGMYDWDGIIIINNNAYLKIDKHYYMN
ncbi:A-kinase anchor protein 11 [Listeria monocytogenes]|nr:A-kinase anchor protein 11 [Listeria monocytogenes]EHC6354373.1 A-kinase anchor protein 11 [Listeria monocytogenes]EJN4578245.1 A-kinase anchor protein 11 [Listeria monocytogenes]MDD88299.1 A-kinase anchor protein 11 [Listeria monocytogenes]